MRGNLVAWTAGSRRAELDVLRPVTPAAQRATAATASPALALRVAFDQTRPGRHRRLSAWRTIASSSGSAPISRTSCAQVNGRWQTPEEVPGLAALNKGNNAGITSVSCASADHCSAAGTYAQTSHIEQAFVITQT
jgi:hypothetical protein